MSTTIWRTASDVAVIEPPSIVFEDIDDAMAARRRPVHLYARVGGEVVEVTEAHTRHGVNMLVGTCTIHCRAPRAAHMQMNAEVEIEAGYSGATRRIFHGFIPNDESVSDDRGQMLRIDGVGWASRFRYPEQAGIEIAGPVSLKDAFRSLCLLRGIPTFLSDDTTYVDGATEIMLGGNTLIDEGHIRIDNRTSPASWLQRVPPLYGYRAFDSPDGTVRLARVSGLPSIDQSRVSDTPPANQSWTAIEGEFESIFAIGQYAITDFADQELYTGNDFNSSTLYGLLPDATVMQIISAAIVYSGNRWYKVKITGYPDGWVRAEFGGNPTRWRRVTFEVLMEYAEGVNAYSLSKRRDREQMVTFWTVEGARYTDFDGGTTQIRSIPESVPYAVELDPPGYIADTVSSQDIHTAVQAEGVRNALEVDRSEVYEGIDWDAAARPDLQPADVVTLTGASHDLDGQRLWLMSIDQSVTDRGYIARMGGWRGAGQALSAGVDSATVDLGFGTLHYGDEYLSHYRVPATGGLEIKKTFTVSFQDYTSLRLIGLCHGTNSFGAKTPGTGSAIEIWQRENPALPESGTNEFKRVGSLTLPTVDEELPKRRPYGASDRYWTKFSLPITGTLREGAAEMRFVSGKTMLDVIWFPDGTFKVNPDGKNVQTQDDGEVKDLKLVYAGIGVVSLPGSL